MIQLIAQCGIGLLVGCVLMLAFFPFIHLRAVRLTKRELTATTSLTTSEIHADKDQMRAEFAMSVRRLEIGMEKMREKAMTRLGPVDKRTAELNRLQVELDKKTAMIATLRARVEVRKSLAKRIVKLLLHILARMRRRQRPAVSAPPLFKFEQGPQRGFEKHPAQTDLAATAAAIAAVNLKRRRAISNKVGEDRHPL
jgi:hypothetical protein